MVRIASWLVTKPNEPMIWEQREVGVNSYEVIVQVAGCGVCHTDLGFYYDGVPTRHEFPLTLGHEISGTVVEAGSDGKKWLGKNVVIPAVIPCGICQACKESKGSICPKQIFPGNDVHGGFGTHVCVPVHGLCEVPDLDDRKKNPQSLDLASLAVLADAVTTPYQAILRSQIQPGDLAVFVGIGGVGSFGVQIARAFGAKVAAVDVNKKKLDLIAEFGAALCIDAKEHDEKAIRQQIKNFAKEHGIPTWRQHIFETSGVPEGQAVAFNLLGPGGSLFVVGYSPKKIEIRLSNLMAFDAKAMGNWGCLPEYYPTVLDLVLSGKVVLPPFIERRPMSKIHEVFHDLQTRKVSRRVVLLPEK